MKKAVAVDPADRLFGSSILPLLARCTPRLYFYALILPLFMAVLWVFLCQFWAKTGKNPGGHEFIKILESLLARNKM